MFLLAAAVLPLVTIEQVLTTPERFDGQRVRMIGWINRCDPLNCSLSERLASRPINAGRMLSTASSEGFEASIKPLLPLKIQIETTIDAACLTKWVCTDRAPILNDVKILAYPLTKQPFPDK